MSTKNQTTIVDRGPNTFIDWDEYQKNPYHFSTIAQPSPPPRPIDEPDTNNATYIPYQEYNRGSSDYERYKRLDQYNSGLRNLKWVNGPYVRYLNNSRLIETLGVQLELTELQFKRVRHRFLGLDLRGWGQPAELIAFCVCAVTVHEDETPRKYHYNQSPENRDSLFEQMAEGYGLTDREVRREYAKVERHFRHSKSDKSYNYQQFEERREQGDRYVEGYINPSAFSLLEKV